MDRSWSKSFSDTDCRRGSSKHQAPEKLQAPSSTIVIFGIWSLGFLWTNHALRAPLPQGLELGSWSFSGSWCLVFGAYFQRSLELFTPFPGDSGSDKRRC